MNKNIDLTKILKDCPDGWKFFTPICGEVEFKQMEPSTLYPIIVTTCGTEIRFTKEGFYFCDRDDAECLIFPSREQRDWSKFTAPWYKKDKFDPKTLKPFDKVLVRCERDQAWLCNLFSHIGYGNLYPYRYSTAGASFSYCIPYNDETKHLVGTTDEAPEYYKYWKD